MAFIEWQQLKYFVTVARTGHITRSAESLSISQPALSRSIANLEKELGIALFKRLGRNIYLNRYGEIFLQRVEIALKEIENARQEIKELIDPSTGEVSLAFFHMMGINFVPTLLRSYRDIHPHMRFQLLQHSNNELLLTELKRGRIDFCITTSELITKDMNWHPLTSIELFLVVPKQHELADKAYVRLTEIQPFPFISLKRRCGLSLTITEFLGDAGIKPNTVMEADELDTIIGLVAADFGITIAPVNDHGIKEDRLAWIKISEPRCQLTVGMIWMKNRILSPAAEQFKNYVDMGGKKWSACGQNHLLC